MSFHYRCYLGGALLTEKGCSYRYVRSEPLVWSNMFDVWARHWQISLGFICQAITFGGQVCHLITQMIDFPVFTI